MQAKNIPKNLVPQSLYSPQITTGGSRKAENRGTLSKCQNYTYSTRHVCTFDIDIVYFLLYLLENTKFCLNFYDLFELGISKIF